MSFFSMEALKARLIEFGHIQRIALLGMKPDRASVMVGGLSILMAAMQELGITSITPIEAGLRMGVLWDLQMRATKRDRRDQSVQEFLQRFHVDLQRAEQVAECARMLYLQLKPATDALNKFVSWSALLHEVGVAVSHTSYHKHGAYLTQNADLPGFTTREQRVMSALILAQKGNLRKIEGLLADADFTKAVLAIRLAVMFMHTRSALETDDVRIRMRSKIELEVSSHLIEAHPTVGVCLEKERDVWLDAGVEFAVKRLA